MTGAKLLREFGKLGIGMEALSQMLDLPPNSGASAFKPADVRRRALRLLALMSRFDGVLDAEQVADWSRFRFPVGEGATLTPIDAACRGQWVTLQAMVRAALPGKAVPHDR